MFSEYLLHLCIRCRFKVIHTNIELLKTTNHTRPMKCQKCKLSYTTYEYAVREYHTEKTDEQQAA